MSKTAAIQLEHIPCNLCGSADYRVRYRKPDTWLWLNPFSFPVVECTTCGLVYVNPRPTPESMTLYYPPDFFSNRDSEAFTRRYASQAEFLPPLTKENVLDIGCAKGDWLHFLQKKYPGIHCVGVDIYPEKLNYETIEYHRQPLPECDFEEGRFQLITAWAVFEHLHRPADYFAAAARVLAKNGKLIFLVTNSESLYSRRAFKEDIPRHLYHFSEKTLRQYAQKFGFDFSRIVFDDQIWDGRGDGTCFYTLTALFGGNWEKRRLKKEGFFRTQIGRVGRLLDRMVFRSHWEAKHCISGIIICEFTKQ